MGIVFFVVLSFIWIGYKELFLTTFDPNFAAATGVSVALWHYLLMGAVSFTTVGAFESVGAILVVAFLIVPPATAYMLTEDFRQMMLITAALALLISFFGYYLAVWLDGSIAGAMTVVAGLIFGLVFIYKTSVLKPQASKSL
jgi:manganese/zinc/iron transport system permease protein